MKIAARKIARGASQSPKCNLNFSSFGTVLHPLIASLHCFVTENDGRWED